MDLLKILKNVPKGTQLFSVIHGIVKFDRIDSDIEHYSIRCNDKEHYPIRCSDNNNAVLAFSREGKYYTEYPGECILFPSKENRDWNTFVPDLPKLTTCFCFDRNLQGMCIRFYKSKGRVFFDGQRTGDAMTWNYIIPCDKYVLATDYFDPKDNYGNLSDKKW